jgi:hypothetical protein
MVDGQAFAMAIFGGSAALTLPSLRLISFFAWLDGCGKTNTSDRLLRRGSSGLSITAVLVSILL